MNRPSRTSQAVALMRADLDRPASPHGDPQAQRALCRRMRSASVPALVAHITARTRFVDGEVLAAIDAGVRQVVIVGAGYDDRALRFRTPGVRFIEVDHPSTQRDKRSRLKRIAAPEDQPALVPVDLRTDDLARALEAAGHRRDEPTLFICEGLLVYLDHATILHLLGVLRDCAAPGSRLVASLAIHADGLDSAEVVAARNAARRTAAAEPWRTILPADEHCELVRAAGWDPVKVIDDHELEPTALPGRSLLVQADPVY